MAEQAQGFFQRHPLHPITLTAFLTPIISAPSGRALAPLLIATGLWCLVRAVRDGSLKHALIRPAGALVASISVLVFASSTWARVPEQAVDVGMSFAGLGLLGLLLLSSAERLSQREIDVTRKALVLGVLAGLVLLAIGYGHAAITNEPLWGKEGQHAFRTLSHAQTVISIVIVPVLVIGWQSDRKLKAATVGIAVLGIVTFSVLDHGASVLAVFTALIAVIFIRIAGRNAIFAMGAFFVVAILLMPWLLDLLLPSSEEIAQMTTPKGPWPSEIHRFHMWRFVLENIGGSNLWLGAGADASRGFPGANEKILWGIELMPLHPHNGALQIWLELGLAGALAVAALVATAYRGLTQVSTASPIIGAAFLAAFMAPWMLSYGIWQSWWIAMAWIAIALGRGLTLNRRD